MIPPSFSSPDRNFFPSFAPSPEASPPRTYITDNEAPVHKITIDLPETFVESTTDDQEGSLCESSKLVSTKQTENIRVYCRFRPSSAPSHIRYDQSMIDDGDNKYSFDGIFGKYASQKEIFNVVAWSHIDSFFKGQNSTIFTYGQTGSGKTFTMFGNLKEK